MKRLENKNILIAVTGCIGVFKICSLVSTLYKAKANVQVAMTRSSEGFVHPRSFQALSSRPVLRDGKQSIGDMGMDHIEFARWADVFLVAPCTANTIAKLSLGLGDDIVSTLSLSCTVSQLIAPAMNVEMYKKPVVQRNLETLKSDGFTIIPPEEGIMACGEEGVGRLAEEGILIKAIQDALV
jgi:phosphopantothenoylcysteine decarboxylase / phosphopantothenate---cysteine ligase